MVAIHSWTHITEKKTSQLNRFCVLLLRVLILFSDCFVIVIALKTPFFLICALRLYRRLFSLSLLVSRYILIRMFFFHFINNGIIRHRTKLSQPEPKETIQWAWVAGGELDSVAISFSLLAFNQCLYSFQLPYPSFVGTVCEFPFLLSFTFCDSASVPLIYQGVTHNRLTVLRVETLSMCQSVCCWFSFPFGLMGTLLALGLLVLGSALVPNSVRKCSFLCLLFHMN